MSISLRLYNLYFTLHCHTWSSWLHHDYIPRWHKRYLFSGKHITMWSVIYFTDFPDFPHLVNRKFYSQAVIFTDKLSIFSSPFAVVHHALFSTWNKCYINRMVFYLQYSPLNHNALPLMSSWIPLNYNYRTNFYSFTLVVITKNSSLTKPVIDKIVKRSDQPNQESLTRQRNNRMHITICYVSTLLDLCFTWAS